MKRVNQHWVLHSYLCHSLGIEAEEKEEFQKFQTTLSNKFPS